MYLGALADDGINAKALPWSTAYRPDMGVTDGPTHFIWAADSATAALRSLGFTGKIGVDGPPEVTPSEGADIVRIPLVPNPELLAWLKAKGYTLKVAHTSQGKEGTDYGSLWDAPTGNIVSMSGRKWSNKRGVMEYVVLGVLGAIAGGAALQAISAAGAGAGAAAPAAATAAPAAATVAPAAAAVAPAAAAAAPTTAAVVGSTLIKAAPAVIGAVAKVAQTNAETKAAQEQTKAAQEQAAVIESITKPAASSSILTPVTPATLAPTYAYSDEPRATPSAAPATKLPPWVIPAAIGAAALVALPLLLKRR